MRRLFAHPIFHAFSWFLVLAYMGGIFWLSHQPSVPLPLRFPFEDKFFHFLAYHFLAFLLANAYWQGGQKRRFWVAFFVAALYGISDELHQAFVPGREASVLDWLADAFGAWAGAYLYLKSEGLWRRKLVPLPVDKTG